jgi:hypothetical protein
LQGHLRGQTHVNFEAPDSRTFAREDPRGFLASIPEGAVLDEIQRAPDLSSFRQEVVDSDPVPGKFILTGSQQFELMNQDSQSLAGRTALLRLLPLSNAVIPAVVLFSSMIGIGLIGLENREPVLDTLRVLNTSIARITRFIVSLTPFGVFAIGAVTAGTMTPETFVRLEVYFITFGAASLLLAFLVLPLLVTAMTPFRYREVIGISREALLTAFVANNAFIVLPRPARR